MTPRRAWSILALATAQQMCLALTRTGLTVLAPFVRSEFGLSVANVGLLFWAFDLGSLLAVLPSGVLGDRGRERRVLSLGALLTASAVALAMFSPSYPVLILLLFVAGIGYPTGHTAGSRAVMLAFSRTRRGLAMAVRQSGFSVGGLAAALCLPRIASVLGWRTALLAAAVLLALAGLLCGLASVWPTAEPPRSPVLRALSTLTANRQLMAATTAGSLLMVGQVAFLGFFVLDLVDRFHQTPVAAASALGLVHVAGGCSRLAWGRISDRWLGGRRAGLLQLLTLGTCAELAWLGFADPQSLNSTLFALLAGITIQGWSALYATLVTELVGPAHAATATGLTMTLLFTVAMLTSPVFGGVVDVTASYRVAWATVSLAVLIAVPILQSIREDGGPVRNPTAS